METSTHIKEPLDRLTYLRRQPRQRHRGFRWGAIPGTELEYWVLAIVESNDGLVA